MRSMSKWHWLWQRLTRKLWVRTSFFCVVAVITALASIFLKQYIPEDISRKVGADSVDRILQIIATSMLAVTTFSLSTMVAAYSAATSNVTPRSTQLLLEDRVAQNALSVFLGSFLYSIVGIIALTMGVYGESGRLVLFVVTILVILIIVTVLIQWVNYLTRLGRVSQTTDMVEKETNHAIASRRRNPYLGGMPLVSYTPHASHVAVRSDTIGYVQHIDVGALQAIAVANDMAIYVQRLPGAFNDAVLPLAVVSKQVSEEIVRKIIAAFSLGGDRSFDQDPRFGFVVLSEIASRALSPAINDPGTAIDVIGTGMRLLAQWLSPNDEHPETEHENVYVPSIHTRDMLDDIFVPIARDGAAIIEIGIRLQKCYATLYAMADKETQKDIVHHSAIALKRAMLALTLPEDKETLTKLWEDSFVMK